MDKFKLRTYDGIALAGCMMIPWLVSTGLGELVKVNNTAAWMTILFSFVIILGLFLIFTSLMRQYEGKNIIEIISLVLGRPMGIFYGIALSIYLCFFTGIHIREGAEIIKIYGMPLTPIYIVAGLLILAPVIMNFFGGRAVVKSVGFFFVLLLCGIIFTMLIGLTRYNLDYLFPLFGNGIVPTLKNSLFTASMIDGVLLLFLFAPSFTNTAAMKKSGTIAIVLTAAISVVFCMLYIMMFSPIVASTLISGFLEIGKASYYNHFFYRFESFLLFFAIFSFVISATIGLFIARESIRRTFNCKPSKIITVLCALLVIIAVCIPENIITLINKYLFAVRHTSVFFIAGFPLLVLIINSIKRLKKNEKN